MKVYSNCSKYLYLPGGGGPASLACCIKHNVHSDCLGLCYRAPPRQLPANVCTQFYEIIAKCWAIGMCDFDNISRLYNKVYNIISLKWQHFIIIR